MNDKIVINTISKIYFTIVSFLSFIFLMLCVFFILLQNGIYIDNISYPNLKISKLYIKWNKKINITADEIKIIKQKKGQSKIHFNIKEANKYFKKALLFDTWFEKITINKIKFNEIEASFKYIDGNNGFLNISSHNFLLQSSLFFESKLFNIQIDKFHDYKRNIDAKGNIIFDAYNLELTSHLKTTINKDTFLDVFFLANNKKAFYKIKSEKKIKNITHMVDMFHLDKRVRYWVVDAINMKNLSLDSLYGWIDYKNLNKAYKNIYAKATLNSLNYTYDKKLDAIHTKNTVIEFKNGVLNIKPHNAFTYGFFLDASWLKIDFTKKEELLTLYLNFNAVLNRDILNLLERYKIKLPFKQNSGNVDTNLTLDVNLRTIDVEAHGDFFTKKGNFKYLGLNIDVNNTYVKLDNFDVKIRNMSAKYKDIATADVNADFNAKIGKGEIYFDFKNIDFKNINLHLKNQNNLNVVYHISPQYDTIDINTSRWSFKNHNVEIEKQTLPFALNTLSSKIPATLIKVDDTLFAYVSGKASFKPIKFNLVADVLKFKYKNIKLAQSSTEFNIDYSDENLNIKSTEDVRIKLDELKPVLKNISASIKGEQFRLANADVLFEGIAQANLNGYYNNSSKSGYINIKKLDIEQKNIKDILKNQKNINFAINTKNNKIVLNSKKLGIKYVKTKNRWEAKFNSIKKLSKFISNPEIHNLDSGYLVVFKNKKDKDIKFKAHMVSKYKILVKDNIPVKNYTIVGKLKDLKDVISVKINDNIKLDIDKEIKIYGENASINLNELLRYFNNKDTNSTDTKAKNIFLKLKNSHLWIAKDRHIISDSIDLQYFNNITTAQLKYKDGEAGFKFDNGKFHLYGEKFNDKFMENLFPLSNFKGGKLSFSMNGSIQEYDGIFYVTDTIILDYKILNNILAFINTIPALVTFSLPGYNKNGLAVKSAYANFHSKNNTIKFKNIYLDSKEMDIVGRGKMSFKRNEIDLILNLKTDLGSSVNKIPVVGYILLGDDTISTSLSITGKLNNPTVKSLIAKDIIMAPLNIIKRTLTLPFNIFENKKKNKN